MLRRNNWRWLFSMFALYKITNMAELQSVSHMLSTRVYNEILIREDVVDEIFDSFVVVFYDLIIKNLNKPKVITTYLEKREDTIISLLDNFGILQVGMPLFLQCEKQDILVCIKINSRTIVIGRISDDVVNDFDLIDSYLDYNCILKDFKVYENKTSNIIIELRRGQIVSQNRDTDEIDLSDEPNEELPFDDNYSENDVKTIKIYYTTTIRIAITDCRAITDIMKMSVCIQTIISKIWLIIVKMPMIIWNI